MALRSAAGMQRLRFAAKCCAGVGAVGGVVLYNRDEGFRRGIRFNLEVVPIALHYKAVEFQTRNADPEPKSAAFAKLHVKYAPIALDIVLRQKGFYVKTAQFLSQYPDFLPPEYIEAFKVLRDDAPTIPFNVVKDTVETELGQPLNEMFSYFDTKPLGSASIGQVHSAKLCDGTEVVVKVQYPEAERQFYIDVDLSIRCAKVLAPHYVDILKNLQKTFANEFDYRREAALQREAHDRLNCFRDVVVPVPYDDQHPKCCELFGRGLVAKHVFTMERLRGKPVDKWANEMLLEIAVREKTTPDEVLKKLQSMSQAEIERLVPSEWKLRAYGMLLNFRDAIRNTAAFSYNWSLGWIGTRIDKFHSPRPVNVHQVADLLFRVQSKCIFEEGFFNADPHAGNILLLDDGRLGLIDWGQVDRMSDENRNLFSRALLAVADRDEPLVAKLGKQMGVKTEKGMDWACMKLGMYWLGSFADDVVGELGSATTFEQNLSRVDPLVTVPEEYFAAVRCMMMTRGVAALMGLPFVDSSARMSPAAQACLLRQGTSFETKPGQRLPRPNVSDMPDLDALLKRHAVEPPSNLSRRVWGKGRT